MKLQIASDLHLEFPKNRNHLSRNLLIPKADYLILAGDILSFKSFESDPSKYQPFLKYCSENWKETFIVPGNHEYYGSDVYSTHNCSFKLGYTNVRYFNSYWFDLERIRLIFSTLWSKIDFTKSMKIMASISDFKVISGMNVDEYYRIFVKQKSFLHTAIQQEFEKCVVITHYSPTNFFTEEKYKESDLNSSFTSEILQEFLPYSDKIAAWIFGHTHQCVDSELENIHFVSNQLGYVDIIPEVLDFNYSKVIEI